jgi:hypothetical protein
VGLFSKKKKQVDGDMPVLLFSVDKLDEIGLGGNFARQLNNKLFEEIPLKLWCPSARTMFLTGEMEIQGVSTWCIALDDYTNGGNLAERLDLLVAAITKSSVASAFIGYYMANSDENYGLVWDFDIERNVAPGADLQWLYHIVDRSGHGNEGHDYGIGYVSFLDVFEADTVRQ